MAFRHYFRRERRKELEPWRIPRVRLNQGELLAEIIEDRRLQPRVFHCVVQRDGSPEILFWGQFRTLQEAERAIEEFFRESLPASDQRSYA